MTCSEFSFFKFPVEYSVKRKTNHPPTLKICDPSLDHSPTIGSSPPNDKICDPSLLSTSSMKTHHQPLEI